MNHSLTFMPTMAAQYKAREPSGKASFYELAPVQVAHGYRRPVPVWWPPELALLIVRCWDGSPDRRPAAQEVWTRRRLAFGGCSCTMRLG